MLHVILLSGIVISAFLTLLLLNKRNKSVSEIILLFWIFTSGYVTFSYLMVVNGEMLNFPTLTALGFSIPLLSGPLMFLYIKYQTKPIFFQKIDLLHLIPFVFSTFLFLKFFFLPHSEKVKILLNNAVEYQIEGVIKLILTYISGVIYIVLSFVTLFHFKIKFKKEFSNSEKINFNWLLMLNIGLAIIWIVVIFIQDDDFIFGSASIYVICIGYFGMTQVNVFTKQDIIFINAHSEETDFVEDFNNKDEIISKNNKSELNQKIYFEAITILKNEKMYLNSELKLIDLAVKLNIHPNTLSKSINQISEANFYDLVNKMRVEEFLSKTNTEDLSKFTIISLAYDSGFNSKATFYRNFKDIMGMSPSDYIKSQAKK